MKKFSFSLEPVLRYKNDRLEIIRNEHAEMINCVMQQEQKIKHMKEENCRCEAAFNKKKLSGITPIEAMNCQNYLEQQECLILRECEVLKEIQRKEAVKKEELLEAKKEVLTIEKLRETNVEEYQRAVNREIEQSIEEFVSNSQAAKLIEKSL